MTDQIITPLPEVVDRYTICQLKLERLDHTQIDVDSMKDQLEYYKKGIDFTNTQLIKLSKDVVIKPFLLKSSASCLNSSGTCSKLFFI